MQSEVGRRARRRHGGPQTACRQRRGFARRAARSVRGRSRGSPCARRGCGTSTCSSSAAWPCNDGQIAEMKTGEGKTLVSTLAGYLNALSGNNVHIVTVNDYLARRDSEWMGQIYRFLGHGGGAHPERHEARPQDSRLPRRRHLRHELGVRLRLPARQHGHARLLARAARPPLRHRGRGGLHPHRRGAHPAHHLGRGHAGGRDVQASSRASCRG